MSTMYGRLSASDLEKDLDELERETDKFNSRLEKLIELAGLTGEERAENSGGEVETCNSVPPKIVAVTSIMIETNAAFRERGLGRETLSSTKLAYSDCREITNFENSDLFIESFVDGSLAYNTVFSDCHPVVTPWTFSLRLEPNKEFEDCILLLTTKVQNGDLKIVTGNLKSGSFVIGCEGEQYFRAVVTYVDSIGLCDLVDVDSGKFYVRPVEMLWQIDKDCAKVPCQAISCCLSGLPNKIPYWSMTLNECFRKLLKQFQYYTTIKDRDEGLYKYKVHLRAVSGEFSFDANQWGIYVLLPFLHRLAWNPELERKTSLISFHPKIVYSGKRIVEINTEIEDKSCIVSKQRYVRQNSFFPNVGEIYAVYVANVISPDKIYMHVISQENAMIDRLEQLLREYYSIYKLKFRSKTTCKEYCNKYCAVQYDNRWFRARIVDWLPKNDKLVELFLIDFGIKKLSEFKLIQPLVDWLKNYPQYAVLCRLPLSPTGNKRRWSRNSLRALDSALNKDNVYQMRIVGISQNVNVPYVSLFCENENSRHDVCEFMITNGYAKANSMRRLETCFENVNENVADNSDFVPDKSVTEAAASEIDKCHRILYPAPDDEENLSSSSNDSCNPEIFLDLPDLYKEPIIPEIGTKVNIVLSVIMNVRSYYCIINRPVSMSSHSMLKCMNDDINKWVRKRKLKPVFNPFFGEIVVARFEEDGKWYRARIIGHVEENLSVRVFFVDYGNTVETNVKELRKIIKEFLQLPFQAVKLFVSNIPQVPCKILSEMLLEKCSRLLGKDIQAVVENVTPENEMHVRLFNDANVDIGEVVTQLIAKGCLCDKVCKKTY